jgi:hypothetical protein
MQGEREQAEMRLCFGEQCEASKLLNSNCFVEACAKLYGPLIDSLVS